MRAALLLAMTGHNPHRIEGKARDAERQHAQRASMREDAERGLPTEKELRSGDAPAPSRTPAEEEIGGSRPGVPSRVKEALERLEDKGS